MLLDLKLKPRLLKSWIVHCYPLGGLQNRRYFLALSGGRGQVGSWRGARARHAQWRNARKKINRQAYKWAICTMKSFSYYGQNPSGFSCLVQIAAFVIYTSMGLPILNMKGKTKRILVVEVKWRHRASGLLFRRPKQSLSHPPTPSPLLFRIKSRCLSDPFLSYTNKSFRFANL